MTNRQVIISIILLSILWATAYALNPFGTSSRNLRARLFSYNTYRIPSGAMTDTLMIGDFIWVNTSAYSNSLPERNDVIVFRYPQDPSIEYVKCVIAQGGEKVRITEGRTAVDGKAIDQDYIDIKKLTNPNSLNMEEIEVPKDHLFVMGDNRDRSNDSRYWGFVPTGNVAGKVTHIWFSRNADRIFTRVK